MKAGCLGVKIKKTKLRSKSFGVIKKRSRISEP